MEYKSFLQKYSLYLLDGEAKIHRTIQFDYAAILRVLKCVGVSSPFCGKCCRCLFPGQADVAAKISQSLEWASLTP